MGVAEHERESQACRERVPARSWVPRAHDDAAPACAAAGPGAVSPLLDARTSARVLLAKGCARCAERHDDRETGARRVHAVR